MGFLDRFSKKKEEKKELQTDVPEGKYDEECSLCGAPGSEKKWMGQYWHKKCLRQMKKGAKKMI